MLDIILILVVLPLLGIFVSSLGIFFKRRVMEMFIAVFAMLVLLGELTFSVMLLKDLNNLKSPFTNTLTVDWFSAVLTVIISGFCTIIGLYSVAYFERNQYFKFYTIFFTMFLGLILTVLAKHLIIFFLGWELMVVSGYILVVFNQTKAAYEAGMKYLVISSYGSLSFLFGIGLLSGVVPSFYYNEMGRPRDTLIGNFALAFMVIGIGVTAGRVFLNQWLPDAHPEAPSPVSGLLSGIVVKMGIYALFRIFSLLSPSMDYNSSVGGLMISLGILTMFEGNIMVFAQFLRKEFIDYKRILAYSTTVHLGFLLVLVPVQSTAYALCLHILNHGLAKILLFLISGTLIHRFNSRDLRKLQGVGAQDKVLGLSLFIGLMSLAGFPGTGGFISKLTILLTFYSISGPNMNLSLFLILINTFLAFVGYLWILKKLVFDKPIEDHPVEVKEGWIPHTTYIIISSMILLLGLYPPVIWLF